MTQIINFENIKNTPTVESPYPHFMVEQSLAPDYLAPLLKDFPSIDKGGSFPLDRESCGRTLLQLIDEFDSPEFRQLMEEKLDITGLADRPMVATFRGVSRPKDGRIHTDSKSKLVTILVYMNEKWDADTGRLRVLYDGKNIDHYLSEVPATVGSMIAFKVTNNCWHGYIPYDGMRRSVQINYVISESASRKHYLLHALSARLKRLFKTAH